MHCFRPVVAVGLSLSAAVGLTGCGEETCDPSCRAGFTCFRGICIPAFEGDADDAGEVPDVDIDANPDVDGDTVPNTRDNCIYFANADQANCDGDVEGDACDGDVDGDGLPNGVDPCDDCGSPPADTHDEDGDGFADVCDNCPETPNTTQADADGDGVGDACEHPLGHWIVSERALFITFAVSPDWAGWPRGAWQRVVDPDHDELVQNFEAGAASAWPRDWSLGDDVTVRAVAEWRTGADATFRLAGVLLRMQGDPPLDVEWYYCCANAVGHTVQIWMQAGGRTELVAETPLAPIAIDPGVRYGIAGSVLGGQVACAVESGGETRMVTADATEPLSGSIGVRTYGTSAAFSSISIYR